MAQSLLLILLVGVLAWFLRRLFSGRTDHAAGAQRNTPRVNPFSAVSVYPAPSGCPAAKAVKGRRFLSREAPHLPLLDCHAEKCHCVYHHHADRRTGNGDRRAIGSSTNFMLRGGNGNRRSSAGRRRIDKNGDLGWT